MYVDKTTHSIYGKKLTLMRAVFFSMKHVCFKEIQRKITQVKIQATCSKVKLKLTTTPSPSLLQFWAK